MVCVGLLSLMQGIGGLHRILAPRGFRALSNATCAWNQEFPSATRVFGLEDAARQPKLPSEALPRPAHRPNSGIRILDCLGEKGERTFSGSGLRLEGLRFRLPKFSHGHKHSEVLGLPIRVLGLHSFVD